MALQQTGGWTSVQADDAFRSTQQGYGVNVTQPAFIAAATQHSSSDDDLSAFLTGADMDKGTNVNQYHSSTTFSCLVHQARQPGVAVSICVAHLIICV